MKREQIIKALEEFTKSFECYHQGYVEACGLICKVRREMIYDLSNKRHPECNENCKDYGPFPERQAMRNALSLIKELTEENERLEKYLDDHFPKCIYQYDGEVQEYCVLAPCGKFNTVAEFQKKIEADTVRKMHDMIKTRCIEGGIYPAFVARTIEEVAKELAECYEGRYESKG